MCAADDASLRCILLATGHCSNLARAAPLLRDPRVSTIAHACGTQIEPEAAQPVGNKAKADEKVHNAKGCCRTGGKGGYKVCVCTRGARLQAEVAS